MNIIYVANHEGRKQIQQFFNLWSSEECLFSERIQLRSRGLPHKTFVNLKALKVKSEQSRLQKQFQKFWGRVSSTDTNSNYSLTDRREPNRIWHLPETKKTWN
jgi:hypothetical protein